MVARYRKKGTYADGRTKIIIEYSDFNGKFKTMALPKPEKLIKLLDAQMRPPIVAPKVDGKKCALREP